MIQLLQVSVENEMDLTLAYKKSSKAAELLGLSISTQTAFATAVSEVCREVIDKTHEGAVRLEVHAEGERFNLAAIITYLQIAHMGSLEEGLQYARKLIPVFNSSVTDFRGTIELKLSIPRSARVNREKMLMVKRYFEHVEPATPYEEVRQRNMELFLINEKAEEALQQAEYLNAQKNEFLSVASHELKTPLTILKAYIQMAIKSNDNPATESHLKKVDVQTQKLQTMIQQLLDISKIEVGRADYNMELVDFNAYLEDMTDLIHQLVPMHELVVELGVTAVVALDKLRMEQVIMNIAGNAAKYSPAGSRIKMCTKIIDGPALLFSVEDEGMGMSEEELLKVFEKFYRVEHIAKFYNGLGMGLYICSKIINDHDGKIWVESSAGKGSTFMFTLPFS